MTSSTSRHTSALVIVDTSARLRVDRTPLAEAIDAKEQTLRLISITRSMQAAAMNAARSLSRRGAGHHCIPPSDALIAAAAEEVGADIVHYDHHFDRLATVLNFRSIWLAPAGSLP